MLFVYKLTLIVAVLAGILASVMLGINFYALWKIDSRSRFQDWTMWINIGILLVHLILVGAGLFSFWKIPMV